MRSQLSAAARKRAAHCMAGVLASALLLSVVGCSSGTSTTQQPQRQTPVPPTAAATPIAALPAFSDWRAAYTGADGQLHAVALDGTNDVSGPLLPGMDSHALQFASAGMSADGHLLAYDTNDGLMALDASGRASVQGDPTLAAIRQMYWSLGGRELALCDGEGSVYIAQPLSTLPNAKAQPVPATRGHTLGILLGWVDGTHVAMTMDPTGDSITLGALDVTSGQVRRVATIRSAELSTYNFSLSADGTEALFFNARYRDQPYTPLVDLINVASGAVTPLPQLAQVMGPYSGFTSVAWRRGTSQVAASTGFKENGDLRAWLLDLSTDSASALPDGYYAMGWAPTGSTLVMSTGEQFAVGTGPFDLDAVAVQANGQYTATVLTRNAMSFPFIGFVRTA